MDSDDLAYTVDEACKRSRTSRAFLYQEIASGKLRAKKRGRRTMILPADLQSWLENLPDFKAARRNDDANTNNHT
jgi:excisionase family DNA binding protein